MSIFYVNRNFCITVNINMSLMHGRNPAGKAKTSLCPITIFYRYIYITFNINFISSARYRCDTVSIIIKTFPFYSSIFIRINVNNKFSYFNINPNIRTYIFCR